MNIILSILIIVFFVTFLHSIYKKRLHLRRLNELKEEMRILDKCLPLMEQQKTEFIAIVSYQLRAPLTVIKGYASMILEGSFGTISDEIREAMNRLFISSEKIISLVGNLITMSQVEQGKMEFSFSSQNFVDFVKSVLENTEKGIKSAGLTLSFAIEEGSSGILVNIDEGRLRQVVTHILENAITYTPAHGTVSVIISTKDEERRIRLSITDSGIGMTTEQIDVLFKRFDLAVDKSGKIFNRQDVSEANEHEKSKETILRNNTPGIGTYIAKKMLSAHHGDFWAESRGANSGTTFIIELPFAE